MVPGWVAFKIVSDSPALHSRWLLLLKIEISSNGQNCSILSQNVPKFELYKHNDELFNIYYRIFYELWTFANFDRLCKLEKRGDEIKKKLLLWNYWANLNQNLLKWFLDGPLPNLFPVIPTSNQDGRQAQNRKKGAWNLKKTSPLKLLSQSQPNFAEMILGWPPPKFVSGDPDFQPRWPPSSK